MTDGKPEARVTGERRLGLLFSAVFMLDLWLFQLLGSVCPGGFAVFGHHWSHWAMGAWLALLAFLTTGISLFGGGAIATFTLALRQTRGAAAGSARDPVIRMRDFLRGHPRLTAFLPWVPTLLVTPMLAMAFRSAGWDTPFFMAEEPLDAPLALLITGVLGALMNRFALRSLDAIRDRATDTVTTVDRDETSFKAVAVTARTQGAVLVQIAVMLGVIHGVAQSGPFWMRDMAHGLPLLGYAVAALGFAAWFRKASTIAVGRDGIFIRGTSKERFFAYQDFDEVRLAGMHFDFHRAGKRVLRLQLHGTDDARAEALAERIRAALAQSHRTDGAHLLARAAASGSLGRAAQGAADYRQPAVSREQLWELVEGEATDRTARLAAAEALATSIEGHDRARLRIAANHVADPRVRVTLEELADDDDTSEAPLAHAAPAARLG